MSSWDDIKPWLAKAAPLLGTAVGGPFGAIAGSLVASALGVKDASPDSIKQAIASGTLTGDQIVALKKCENDFAATMNAAGIDSVEKLAEFDYQDRASARTMQASTKSWTPSIGFYLITAGFFSLLAMMLFHQIPDANKAVLYTMVGSLGTAWIGAINYFYGATHMDADTKSMLYNSTPQK